MVDAIGDRTDLVVVAQSFGGFTAPLVCDRLPVDLLVLVAGMVPRPGQPPGDWWANTGYQQARREHDERAGGPPADDIALFLHDVPPDLAAEALRRGRDQSTASPSATPRSWPTAWRRTGPAPRDRRPGADRSDLNGRRLGDQLHPLVVPHDSQTKHEPAGRIRTPQVEQ